MKSLTLSTDIRKTTSQHGLRVFGRRLSFGIDPWRFPVNWKDPRKVLTIEIAGWTSRLELPETVRAP